MSTHYDFFKSAPTPQTVRQNELKKLYRTKNTLQGMHIIWIISGSFPRQTSCIRNGVWEIKGQDGTCIAYAPRAAFQGLEKVSEDKTGVTFRASFKDGQSLVGTTRSSSFDSLHAEMETGVQPGDVASVNIGRSSNQTEGVCLIASISIIALFIFFVKSLSPDRTPAQVEWDEAQRDWEYRCNRQLARLNKLPKNHPASEAVKAMDCSDYAGNVRPRP